MRLNQRFRAVAVATICLLCLVLVQIAAASEPGVALNQTASLARADKGQTFSINLELSTSEAMRGVQFALAFDSAKVECLDWQEGPFFKNWAEANTASTLVFPKPEIDNKKGAVSDMGVALVGVPRTGPTGKGVVATFRFKAVADKVSTLEAVTLTNVAVADANGATVDVALQRGGVTFSTVRAPASARTQSSGQSLLLTEEPVDGPPWWNVMDVNLDGIINIGDVVTLGNYMNTTVPPTPAWADLNLDGIVNIGDIVTLGNFWNLTWPVSPSTAMYVRDDWDNPYQGGPHTFAYQFGMFVSAGHASRSSGIPSANSVIAIFFGRQAQVNGVWGVCLTQGDCDSYFYTNDWVKSRTEEFMQGYQDNVSHPEGAVVAVTTSNCNYG